MLNPRSGHIQEPTNECINRWNIKLIVLSLSLKSIFKLSLKIMVPRINSLHAPNRKQIHCCQGMPAHQLPPERGGHEGQVPDRHQRISPSIPMPLCNPTCLQILTSVHLPFFKSRTTIFLTLCSLHSFWFLGDPQSPGCYWRFPYFHNFNPLVSPYRSPLAPPPFTC